MKNIRPLEMMLLIFAIIVLVVSIFAAGYYGPELVNIIQHEGASNGAVVSPVKIIISRIGEILTQSLTS